MKTDSLFYHIFLNFPNIFFELINQPNTDTETYEFTSREVKQLSFRLDGLFLPTDGNSNQPFYLVETGLQPDEQLYYRILTLNQVQRIYLDELGSISPNSLGIGVVKLVIEPENQTINLAKSLIDQAKEEIIAEKIQQNLIDLIETIVVYKLPQKTRKEIEAMLGLSELRQTKVYQEALAEGEQKAKFEIIPNLLKEGFNSEKIAQLLNLPLDTVKKIVAENQSEN